MAQVERGLCSASPTQWQEAPALCPAPSSTNQGRGCKGRDAPEWGEGQGSKGEACLGARDEVASGPDERTASLAPWMFPQVLPKMQTASGEPRQVPVRPVAPSGSSSRRGECGSPGLDACRCPTPTSPVPVLDLPLHWSWEICQLDIKSSSEIQTYSWVRGPGRQGQLRKPVGGRVMREETVSC